VVGGGGRGFRQVLGAQDSDLGGIGAGSGDPQGLGGDGPFEQVPDVAGVAEAFPAGCCGEDGAQLLGHAVGELEARAAGHVSEDGGQLLVGVPGEVHGAREAGCQAGVGLQQRVHFGFVSGGDDDEVAAVVFHQLEQGGDGLGAVVAG
jgi:hypothetical protein